MCSLQNSGLFSAESAKNLRVLCVSAVEKPFAAKSRSESLLFSKVISIACGQKAFFMLDKY
jgi:hypothetical protein